MTNKRDNRNIISNLNARPKSIKIKHFFCRCPTRLVTRGQMLMIVCVYLKFANTHNCGALSFRSPSQQTRERVRYDEKVDHPTHIAARNKFNSQCFAWNLFEMIEIRSGTESNETHKIDVELTITSKKRYHQCRSALVQFHKDFRFCFMQNRGQIEYHWPFGVVAGFCCSSRNWVNDELPVCHWPNFDHSTKHSE